MMIETIKNTMGMGVMAGVCLLCFALSAGATIASGKKVVFPFFFIIMLFIVIVVTVVAF